MGDGKIKLLDNIIDSFLLIFNIMVFTLDTGRGQKRRHSSPDSDGSEEDNETLNEKFRQGKNLDELGVEWGNNSENSQDQPDDMNDSEWGNNSENSQDPPDEVNDSEWNMLGAALEKEFLEN